MQITSSRFSLLWIVLVCLGGLACGRKLAPEKVACTATSICPKGYQCLIEAGKDVGHCQSVGASRDSGTTDVKSTNGDAQSTGDSGVSSDAQSAGDSGVSSSTGGMGGSAKLDAAISSGGAGSGGSTGTSLSVGGTTGDPGSSAGGGGISWPDALPPTDAPGFAAGTACTSNSQCSSGQCINDVCCAATSCTGCFACSNALTGQPDGTCAPVANGKIGTGACTDETSTKPCGNDGTCDGKGACRKAAAGKPCGTGTCNADSAYVPAPTCDGKGVCTPGTAQPCSPYPCSSTGCDKKCTKPADCDTGTYCDTSTSTCKATKPNGTLATDKSECSSGVLADGVCCNVECTGCSACIATLNGQDSKTTGTCLPVIKGKTAPHSACPKGTDPCGMDGTCDGDNHCTYPVLASECGTKSCAVSTSMLTKGACDSNHTCKQTTAACPGGLACLANGSDCRPAPCTGDGDCASGSYCSSSGTCVAKSGAGSLCTPETASQCNGGACVDGHCCSVASCGTCQTCTGTGGTCVAVTNAEDADSCTGTKACDATGACKKKSGQGCELGSECLSGNCADKVCCNRACNGACEYCNNAGSPGQCGYITGAPKSGHPTCAGDGTACQGTCKGGKADCDLPGSETTCRQTSCQNTSTQINRATCNGTGNCPAQSTSSCGSYLCSGTACLNSCSGTGSGQCTSGTACIGGECKTCGPGLSACGSSCADLKTDAFNCGSCGNACPAYAPYCGNANCVGCTTKAQCTAKQYDTCSAAGTCVCLQKDANNLLPNPGFDGSASSWTLEYGAEYTATDAHSCPGSGSVVATGLSKVSRCLSAPSGVTRLRVGARYKGGSKSGYPTLCRVAFHPDASCQNWDDLTYLYAGGLYSENWASMEVAEGPVPSGTLSITLQCQTQDNDESNTTWYDEVFLNASSGGF